MKQNVSIKWSSETTEGENSPVMNHINFAFDLIGWMMYALLYVDMHFCNI